MISRLLVRTGVLALPLLAPEGALAQGVTIDHKEIGCIVAGKYPKMNACFAPASLVKKPRVYFRPETLTDWYYVEMSSSAPCHEGVLLRPNKGLIGKTIFYYVDAQGGSARTPEYAPVVVASAEECKTRLPVAPLSATGPAAVFPSYPTIGFVGGGGISAGVVAGGVAAVAVVAGGTKLLTDDGSTATTTPATVPATNPPATAPPATVPPVTVPPTPLVVACRATPRDGEVPLRVDFATFPNGGTGVYGFEWTFGDGGGSTNPNPAHTFTAPGTFNATVRVTSGGQTAICSRPITVTPPPTAPPTTPPTAPPPKTVTLTVSVIGQGDVTAASGIKCPTDCTETYPAGTVVTLTATPTVIVVALNVFKQWTGDCTGTVNPCVLTMSADKTVTAEFGIGPPTPSPPGSPVPIAANPSLAWTSQLEVPDGEGQVVMNGRIASAVRPGLAATAVEGPSGANRVEAVLVRGAGRPGTWRFDFSGQAALKPGSLRVVAGTVALITGDAVVFRLQGKPGERIVFTFEVED